MELNECLDDFTGRGRHLFIYMSVLYIIRGDLQRANDFTEKRDGKVNFSFQFFQRFTIAHDYKNGGAFLFFFLQFFIRIFCPFYLPLPLASIYISTHTHRETYRQSTQRDVTRLDAEGKEEKEIHREGLIHLGNRVSHFSLALYIYIYFVNIYIYKYIYSDITLMLYNVTLATTLYKYMSLLLDPNCPKHSQSERFEGSTK